MMRIKSYFCGTVAVLTMAIASASKADDGFPARVIRSGAEVKIVKRVIGKASEDMLLWVFSLSKDGQWAQVKVPSSEQRGWMSVNDLSNVQIPDAKEQKWQEAHSYFSKWQSLADAGLYEEAAELAENSANSMNRILEDVIGYVYPGYPPAAMAFNQAGVARLRASQNDQAKKLFGQAVEIASASIGADQVDTSIYRANLANALVMAGQFRESISEFDSALPILEANRSKLDQVSLSAYLVRYGTALAEEYRIFDARIAFNKALEDVKQQHGQRSAEVAAIAAEFANAMDQAGQHAESVKQLERSLEIYREIRDDEDPGVVDTLNRLSAFCHRAGDDEASRNYAQQAVDLQEGIPDVNPFQWATSLSNLGLAQTRTGDLKAAEVNLQKALTLMQSATSEDSLASSYPLKNLGILSLKKGDYAEARRLLEQVIEIRQVTASPAHASVGEAFALLAEVAEKEDELPEARQHLLEAVRIHARENGVDHPRTWRNVLKLKSISDDDDDTSQVLQQMIAEARGKMRNRILRDVPRGDYQLDRVATEYRLQRILANRQQTPPDTQFFALEIVEDNASVRTGDLIATTLAKETVVYAFRAEDDQALIKIPGRDKRGWIGQNSVREIKYSGELLQKLSEADEQLDLGVQEHLDGDDNSALVRIRSALRIFDTELGEDSAPAAAARFTLGGVLAGAGDVRVAVEECLKAEAALADLLGETHFETAKARNNLADALLSLGKPAEALRPAAQALQVVTGFGEEKRGFQAKVAGNVGLALMKLTHFEAAREYFDYALELSLQANGEDHFGTARCYSHLGRLHAALQESAEAEAAFGKAYRIAERVSGPTTTHTTRTMVSYGRALVAGQQISAGRKLVEQAAETNLRERGPMDLSTIRSDAAKAEITLGFGDADTARKLMDSVVRRATRRLGEEHPDVLRYQMQLSEAYFLEAQYEKALSEAEVVSTKLRTSFDETTHETIDSIRSVGNCSAALGRLDAARVSYERALRLSQKVLGSDHPDTTECLFNIGEVALMAKDHVAARPRIEAFILSRQQNEDRVVADVCEARTLLGYIDVNQGDLSGAAETFERVARDTFQLISNVLPALSEKEQLLFLQDNLLEMQHAWMSLPILAANQQSIAKMSAIWHLNLKASSFELLAAQTRAARDHASVANSSTFQELAQTRERLARISLRSVAPDAMAAHRERVSELSAEEERLSRLLGDAAAKLDLSRVWVSEADIREGLSNSSVLVNFARVRNANFAYSSQKTKWKGDRYIAFVIPPANAGEIAAVDLGLASQIDARIFSVLNAIRSETALAAIRSRGEQLATADASEKLQRLSDRILQPLLPHVEGFEQLILSPDGQLWTVPWAALPTAENQLAIQNFQIRLAVSGREVLSPEAQNDFSQSSAPPVIVADPSFDTNPAISVAVNELNQFRSSATRFGDKFRDVKRLPGTATEAAAIKGSVEEFAGVPAAVFLRNDAVEAVVKSAKSPQCLVLSTHGFFFEAPSQRSIARLNGVSSIPRNPLLRCGLLLAGCQFADEAPAGTDDGILTGMEIISSDLRDTDLVVLSACETGLGDLRSGEGVAGLRQAFQLAGAKSVVASLWQVEDKATARLMSEFFENLAAGLPKSEALRRAQLSRIQARQSRNGAAHPFFWAAFTLTGQD